MGSPEDEAERRDSEGPRHRVEIERRFALGRYTVTFEEYDAFCEATRRDKLEDEGWGRGRRPVINVSWNNASAYAAWLSKTTGADYRLPSEAEWEYACRAGSETTPFEPTVASTHKGASILPSEANFNGNQTYGPGVRGECRRQTVPVDHPDFRPNAWSLWQMHGNVGEWCEDNAHDDYLAPRTQAAYIESKGRYSQRLFRGGSWDNTPRNLRSAVRNSVGAHIGVGYIGFRLSRTLSKD